MLSITELFDRAYGTARERNWGTIYVMVDIHGTILRNNYGGISYESYPRSMEGLKALYDRRDVVLILYSSCYEVDYGKYVGYFGSYGIHVRYFNENPEISNTLTGCFDRKPYSSVLLDDKAGFDPDRDWDEIICYFGNGKEFLEPEVTFCI